MKNELLLHFSFHLLGKMSRLDESHGRPGLSKRFFHMLFEAVRTSLVLTPKLNQREVPVFQQILEN